MILNLFDGLLAKCILYVGRRNFGFVAGVCCSFWDEYKSYLHSKGLRTMTSSNAIVDSVSCVQMVINTLDFEELWKDILCCAASKGKLDVLSCVKDNKKCFYLGSLQVYIGNKLKGYRHLIESFCGNAAKGAGIWMF